MARDSIFAVGLKSPGALRGVAKGKPLLSHGEWLAAASAIAGKYGVFIVKVDTVHLPVVRVRLADIATLNFIRRLPFVDFVEPAKLRVMYADGCDDLSGGSSAGGDSPYGEQLVPEYTSWGGTDYVAHTFLDMGIDRAWMYSTGAGVTIGITDTGLDLNPPSQFSASSFGSGDSNGRTLAYYNLMGKAPVCSHGTRIAGLAAAPRDGNSVVGAAYNSNVVAAYQADGENPDVADAAEAIHDVVAYGGAKVVVMAWGEFNWYDNIANEIQSHYYNNDVVFVGAAGTCPAGPFCPRIESAVFPAEMGEVLAVTGANSDGSRPDNMYDFGTKREGLLAYTNLATTGLGTTSIVTVGGSSAATGAMGGIAALVRAKYPWMNNAQVVTQILATSADHCRNPLYTWRNDLVNAYAAVGGLCPVMGGSNAVGPLYLPNGQATYHFNVSATGGSGNYSYNWVPGGAGQSVAVTFYASGYYDQSYTRRITVNVTDNVTGAVVSRWKDVYVNVQPDPNSEKCGGNIRC